jgi:hypothetical protein
MSKSLQVLKKDGWSRKLSGVMKKKWGHKVNKDTLSE